MYAMYVTCNYSNISPENIDHSNFGINIVPWALVAFGKGHKIKTLLLLLLRLTAGLFFVFAFFFCIFRGVKHDCGLTHLCLLAYYSKDYCFYCCCFFYDHNNLAAPIIIRAEVHGSNVYLNNIITLYLACRLL